MVETIAGLGTALVLVAAALVATIRRVIYLADQIRDVRERLARLEERADDHRRYHNGKPASP